jgi:membrane-associated phospholipid phosphatase
MAGMSAASDPAGAVPPGTASSDPAARRAGLFAALRRRSARPWSAFNPGVPTSWWPDVLLLSAFAALSSLLLWPSPLVSLDVSLRDAFLPHQPGWAHGIAHAFTFFGQGTPLAFVVLCLAAWSAHRYRSVRPLLLYTASYLTLGFVLGLKGWLGRVAPRYPDQTATVDANGATLFSGGDPATSYPSGHAANAVVWYALAVLLIGGALSARLRALLLFMPPLLLVAGQSYLGFHWLSDAPAGFILGIVIVRVIKRIRWATLPLGPLRCFEPPADRDLAVMTVLLAGVLVAGMLPSYGVVLGGVLLAIGVAWWLIRRRR